MTRKKLRILYLARFLTEQSDEEHPVTLQEIRDYLERCGIEADRKSIYDDMEQLRLFGLDVIMEKSAHFGYYLGQRDFQLPELKMLIDVVQSSPFLTANKSMELIGKLEKLASRPQAHQLRRQVYVMNRVRTDNEKLYYTVDGINTAINLGRQVTFRYFDWTAGGKKIYRRDGALYTADPVALCVDRHYYLVAYDAAIADYRHYRVDRMDGLTVTGVSRSPLPDGFDLGQYVKAHFDMYNGQTRTVTLRFARHLTNVVTDRFGTGAHIHAQGDDFALTAQVEVGPTFFGWLFQLGAEAELTAPADVRQAFADYCRGVLELYG
ncbi:MAG: WYL domain-containing protein [Oscillospiraceae bacterium]|nr:WYL domain-containing protein [Oscillospiraceae bacterium]